MLLCEIDIRDIPSIPHFNINNPALLLQLHPRWQEACSHYCNDKQTSIWTKQLYG